MQTLNRLAKAVIIPVVVLKQSTSALSTAKALLAGGIDVMEITLRTSAALDSIREVSEKCPQMLVGAGTVLNLEQAEQAVNNGAKFLVSPGLDLELVSWALEHEITIIPGCVTPTELIVADKLGLNVIKFFPADVYGGIKGMKSLSAPFPQIKFIPTGGINQDNLQAYLEADFIYAVGGSWICPSELIATSDFTQITDLCRKARALCLPRLRDSQHLGKES